MMRMKTSISPCSLTALTEHDSRARTRAQCITVFAQLRQNEFFTNVSKVFAGNGLGFVATFLAIPVISRLYTPSDYGVIGLFVSITSVLVVIATLKYEFAIVLPKTDQAAGALLKAVLGVAVLVSLLTLLGTWVARACCAQKETIASLGNYLWWVPVVVLLTAISKMLLNGWLTRQKEFGRLATAELSNTLVNLGVRILLGFVVGSTVWGLLAGLVLGLLTGLAVAWPLARRGLKTEGEWSMRQSLAAYPEFPTYTMPADFVRTLAQNLPVLMFGFMFSPAVAGLYYMANRLIKAPVELGLHAFRGVYLQRMSAMHNAQQPLRPTYIKTVTIMLLLGVLPAAVLFLFGEELIAFLLGDAWREAGRFAEVLAPLLLSFWVSSPAAMLLITLRKQNYWLAIQLSIALGQLAVFAYAYWTGQSALWALTGFVVVRIGVNLILKLLVLSLLGRPSPAEDAP